MAASSGMDRLAEPEIEHFRLGCVLFPVLAVIDQDHVELLRGVADRLIVGRELLVALHIAFEVLGGRVLDQLDRVVGLEHRDRAVGADHLDQLFEPGAEILDAACVGAHDVVAADQDQHHVGLEAAHLPVVLFLVDQLDAGLTAVSGVDHRVHRAAEFGADPLLKDLDEAAPPLGVDRAVGDRVAVKDPRPVAGGAGFVEVARDLFAVGVGLGTGGERKDGECRTEEQQILLHGRSASFLPLT